MTPTTTTASGPAMSGTHADASVFRRVGWVPANSGIAELDALRESHEQDVEAWERAKAKLDLRKAEHAANAKAVQDSARARAGGADVAQVRPLPQGAKEQELSLAQAEAGAARDVLNAHNEQRRAVIAERRRAWELHWRSAIGTDQAEVDALNAQIDALRERQRTVAVYLAWLESADDTLAPARFASLVADLGPEYRARLARALGDDEAADAVDAPLRRLQGRLSERERMARMMGTSVYEDDDEPE